MKINAIIHNAEEGGLWAEVLGIPRCVTQGDTFEELLTNLYEAIEERLCIEIDPASIESGARCRNWSMKALSGKGFARLFEARGWKLYQVTGRRRIYDIEPQVMRELRTEINRLVRSELAKR